MLNPTGEVWEPVSIMRFRITASDGQSYTIAGELLREGRLNPGISGLLLGGPKRALAATGTHGQMAAIERQAGVLRWGCREGTWAGYSTLSSPFHTSYTHPVSRKPCFRI